MYKVIRHLSFESRLAALTGGSIDLQIKNQIGTILINQPKARNAISGSMMLDFEKVLQEVESNKNLKCILFRGNGEKAFCAGSDLRCLVDFSEPEEGHKFCRYMQDITHRLDRLPIPVITYINGVAYGGGSELSTIGDVIIASPNAKVCWVHKKMALQPGWGGASRLINLVGRQNAVHLLMTSRVSSSEDLLKIGYVQELVGDIDEWIEKHVSKTPPSVLRAMKSNILNSSFDLEVEGFYSKESDVFKSLYGAPENKSAIENVIKNIKS